MKATHIQKNLPHHTQTLSPHFSFLTFLLPEHSLNRTLCHYLIRTIISVTICVNAFLVTPCLGHKTQIPAFSYSIWGTISKAMFLHTTTWTSSCCCIQQCLTPVSWHVFTLYIHCAVQDAWFILHPLSKTHFDGISLLIRN